MPTISGKFTVQLKPLGVEHSGTDRMNLGRMKINKQYEGDLDAEGIGEMLSVITPTKGSAGYVAIEQVSGALNGRTGSFVLQHFGLSERGEQRQLMEVVADTGTGQLKGISGKMTIDIEHGVHYYKFNYTLS